MGGDRVCIVGIDQDSRCIRPMLPPPGVLRKHLYIRKYIIFEKLAICPRAKIKFDFHQVPLKPPHIEDLGFDSNSISYQGFCGDAEWEAVLQASSFHSVKDIYDGLLQEPRWVAPGANTRSLGTVSRTQVTNVLSKSGLADGNTGFASWMMWGTNMMTLLFLTWLSEPS